MWHTSEGDRSLADDEAALLREGMASLVDILSETRNEEDGLQTGVPLFDKLAYPQKIALLCEVGRALLRHEVPMPRLTAVNEAAVAAIYEHLACRIALEIDSRRHALRKMVLNLLRDEFKQEGLKLPPPACADHDEWRSLLDCCADKILWDRDFDEEPLVMDDSPERAEALKNFLRIDREYFVAIPPDPAPEELARHLRCLKGLTAK